MRTVDELEERLSRPRAGLIEDLAGLEGDILVLGAAGKLGPSLVRLAVRAVADAGTGTRVLAVSRFSEAGSEERMRRIGVHTITADIADNHQLAALPDAANVIYLVGAKFGTTGNEPGMWGTNAYLPGKVAERYAGSRMVALSTGNVYPMMPVGSGGAGEDEPPAPVGEYAMSCLGRERVLTHVAAQHDTPLALIRLNYAVEMRYGVLVDLARAIVAGEPVDVTTGQVNLVWQGYANEVTLRSLRHTSAPPFVLNVTGAETASVRVLATELGRLLDRAPVFVGEEAPTALLSDAGRCHALFGYPDIALATLVEQVADWVRDGGPLLGKATKFQRRDGRF
jgi:nucleoside-diphosphate-sugar epimerase